MALPDDFVEYPSIPYPNQILQADTHVYQYDAAKKTWRVLNPTWDYYATFATLDFGTSTYVDLKAVVASYSPDTLTDRYGDVRDIPQRIIAGTYTFKRSDAGKSLLRPSTESAGTSWIIPTNASVPFPLGAAITLINDATTGGITITPTSGVTLQWYSSATTKGSGARNLNIGGMATLVKIELNKWYLSGTGLG